MKEQKHSLNITSAQDEIISDEIVAVISAAVELLMENETNNQSAFFIKRGSQPLSPWCSKTFMHRQNISTQYKR